MSEWYFHNISEDIIYGPINDKGAWRGHMRELKKRATIRKYGNDFRCDIAALPEILAAAVREYRREYNLVGR